MSLTVVPRSTLGPSAGFTDFNANCPSRDIPQAGGTIGYGGQTLAGCVTVCNNLAAQCFGFVFKTPDQCFPKNGVCATPQMDLPLAAYNFYKSKTALFLRHKQIFII